MDTIYALSSGALPSGVAVIRISGKRAGEGLRALAGALPEPRRAALRNLRRPADGMLLDQGLVLWFEGPRSETGEDLAELQVHGSRVVVAAIFEALAGLGLRLAEPGEFARRAFLNGKLDLTEVEGLADLIAAETELQRRQALGQMGGGLASRAGHWREALIGLRAAIEARLDFSDEGDVGEALPADFHARAGALLGDLRTALAESSAGERLRDGFRVAILGRPNAGKSSLLNALARRDVAIVTPEAGTTRDVLEVALDLRGYPVRLFDTAGLREAESAAETEGVRRARQAAQSADLVLWLADATEPAEAPPDDLGAELWPIATKVDLVVGASGISTVTGAGLPALIERLGDAASRSLGRGDALVTRERQRQAIAAAVAALEGLAPGMADEIAADLLRAASDAIGRLSGRVGVEDVLDRLFGEFCIGK